MELKDDIFFINQFGTDLIDKLPLLNSIASKAKHDNFDTLKPKFSELINSSEMCSVVNQALECIIDEGHFNLYFSGISENYTDWRLFRGTDITIGLQIFEPETQEKEFLVTYPNNMLVGIIQGKVDFRLLESSSSGESVDKQDSFLEVSDSGIAEAGKVFHISRDSNALVFDEFKETTIMLTLSSVVHSELVYNYHSDSLKFSHLSSADVDYSRLLFCFKLFEIFGYAESVFKLNELALEHPSFYVRWAAATSSIRLSDDLNSDMALLDKILEKETHPEVLEAATKTKEMLSNMESENG